MGSSLTSSATKITTKNRMSENFKENLKTATFALGCFWHSDAVFGCQKGVYRTRCGYTSGKLPNPTYRNLGDHTEAIEVDYDPSETKYETLLKYFWENHDPTELYKRQYRSAIFYRSDEEKALAIESKEDIQKKIGRPVVTAIEPFDIFHNAEDYHQKYYLQTHHKALFKSLGLTQSDLVDSTLAAKLNGFVVGQNTLDAFNAESETYGLSAENVVYLQKIIAKGKQSHC